MTRPFFLDGLMKAQEQVITEPEYECWSCGSHEPASRIVDKEWRDIGTGEYRNELICFKCIETGVWRK